MIVINFGNKKYLNSAEKFLYNISNRNKTYINKLVIAPNILDLKDFNKKFNFTFALNNMHYKPSLEFLKILKDLNIKYLIINDINLELGFNSKFDLISACKEFNIQTILYTYDSEDFMRIKSLDSDYIAIKLKDLQDIDKFGIYPQDKVLIDYHVQRFSDLSRLESKGVVGFVIRPYIKNFNLIERFYAEKFH
jgi:hypothetical protein